jgi:hypothetical protein
MQWELESPAQLMMTSSICRVASPGLQDAHIQLGLLGESAFYVRLSAASSIADLCAAVAYHANRYVLSTCTLYCSSIWELHCEVLQLIYKQQAM